MKKEEETQTEEDNSVYKPRLTHIDSQPDLKFFAIVNDKKISFTIPFNQKGLLTDIKYSYNPKAPLFSVCACIGLFADKKVSNARYNCETLKYGMEVSNDLIGKWEDMDIIQIGTELYVEVIKLLHPRDEAEHDDFLS